MLAYFLTQLGSDVANISASLGANLGNVFSHLAVFLGGTV